LYEELPFPKKIKKTKVALVKLKDLSTPHFPLIAFKKRKAMN